MVLTSLGSNLGAATSQRKVRHFLVGMELKHTHSERFAVGLDGLGDEGRSIVEFAGLVGRRQIGISICSD